MLRAVELASRGWGRVAPNPLVGAVIVRDGEVVGEGWHTEFGAAHAEVEALRRAGELARGATVYVTLEPCSHHGKTPPCSDALVAAGVSRVVYACADPNPVAEGGAGHLEQAGISVTAGVGEREARDLNGPFFHRFTSRNALRPWIELKLALSLDAAVADREGRSGWITGESARAEVHRLRAGHDAVAVGIGTALADDPQLTVREAARPRVAPVRVVFDRMLRLPPDSRLARSAREIPVLVIASPRAPAVHRRRLEDNGVSVLEAEAIEEALRLLRSEGIASLLCEGGARVGSTLLEAGVVDRLSLFYAPLLLGPGATFAFAGTAGAPLERSHRWRLLRSQPFGADTLISLAP